MSLIGRFIFQLKPLTKIRQVFKESGCGSIVPEPSNRLNPAFGSDLEMGKSMAVEPRYGESRVTRPPFSDDSNAAFSR
jgi:hypothetical protein